MTGRRVTKSDLNGACESHLALFDATFPEGAEATVENVHRARAAGINLAFAENLIPPDRLPRYDEAMHEARRIAAASLHRARDLADTEREAAEIAARAEYERIHAETLVVALVGEGEGMA